MALALINKRTLAKNITLPWILYIQAQTDIKLRSIGCLYHFQISVPWQMKRRRYLEFSLKPSPTYRMSAIGSPFQRFIHLFFNIPEDKCSESYASIFSNFSYGGSNQLFMKNGYDHHDHQDIYTYNLSGPKRLTLDVPNQSPPIRSVLVLRKYDV